MFPGHYWPLRYWAARYWPKGADAPVPPIETSCSGGQLPTAPESPNGNGCVTC